VAVPSLILTVLESTGDLHPLDAQSNHIAQRSIKYIPEGFQDRGALFSWRTPPCVGVLRPLHDHVFYQVSSTYSPILSLNSQYQHTTRAMYLRTYVSQADRCRLADESLKRIENAFRRFKAQALMKEADKLSKEDGVIDVLFGKPRWVA